MSLSQSKYQILLKCQGENSTLILTSKGVLIKRQGGFFNPHKEGEQYITYSDILDFQYHKAGHFSRGFIYLQLQGLDEEINYFGASYHDNAVTFLYEQREKFEKM